MDKQELWHVVLAKIELSISRPSFLTWFQETGIIEIENGEITVGVPNGFAKEWLQNKYHKAILHSLREISPDIKDVRYAIHKIDNAPNYIFFKHQNKDKLRVIAEHQDEFAIPELTLNSETNLNPRYSFDTFIVGSFNELAHAAAQSIIKTPGSQYNPLFFYGGVGLGKTHLIQAIGNAFIRENPHCKVKYLTSEKYMGEIVDALRNQEMNKLKEKYRTIDVLIMDDIQFISKTEKMQEEFFHTFNALYQKNKQIIMSSDRPPQAIASLEERLRSRFEGGMIADIGLPDYETRLTILKSKADFKKVSVPEKVLIYIAENIKLNIRELEGALNSLIVRSRVSNAPITLEMAEKILLSQTAAPKKFISAKKIIKAVADFYDIEEKVLIDQSRKRDVVKPRQIAMYLMREDLKSSYPTIGEKLGGRDHTTAIHSCEKIEQELEKNPEFVEEIKAIREKVYAQ